MNLWKLEDLKASLEKRKAAGKLTAFTAAQTNTERREFYLIQDKAKAALDQARTVDAEKLRAQVFVKKPNGRNGSAGKPLLAFQPLEPQLDSLVEAALIGDEEPWEFPVPGKVESAATNAYPALKTDFAKGAGAINAQLAESISSTGGVFNSAELFVNLEKTRAIASNGFDRTSERSKIYTEVCFSHENAKKESEEFLITQWYSHPEQIDLKKMCEESRDFAKASLETVKPETGSYQVILHADVLAELWNTYLAQVDSQAQYFKMPFREPGQELIPGFTGDAFSLFVDPTLDFCFASSATDGLGVPQKKLRLASGNKIESSLTGARYSQYLKKPMTTDWGCVVIEAGATKPLAELRKTKGKVLEILQFSGMFASSQNLTYSSEIRLARLYDNDKGTVSYVKGGNLSGNILENFRGVRWSSEKTLVNHSDYSGRGLGYSGPAYALVSDVSVSS